MSTDTLANALSKIMGNLQRGKSEVVVKPNAKLIREVLRILKEEGYIKEFKPVSDKRGGYIKVVLGEINALGVIKPRFSVTLSEFEKYEKRYLPARDFGALIVSTSKGLMTHYKAKEEKIGGVLIAYVY